VPGGVGITESPRELIRKSGAIFLPADKELTCCGFGGTCSSRIKKQHRVENFPMTIFCNFLLDRFGQNPYPALSPEIDTIAHISNKNISNR
jgi:hypothetical protein